MCYFVIFEFINILIHKVPVENFLCIWRTHYLAGFPVGKRAFQFFSLDKRGGIWRCVLSITGKEIKNNFLPVLYIRTPS
jgi:hypothetical protein